VHVRLLGRMAVDRGGEPLALPSSRKVRAFIAYVALASRPVTRSQLCELLWDAPNDPRGELRWCLSKARGILDRPDRQAVQTRGDMVALDLAACSVDAVEVARAIDKGLDNYTRNELDKLCSMFAGDFLDGLEIDRSPQFQGWLVAQRRRFRGCQTALLEHLAGSAPDDEKFGYLEQWLALAPFDQRVHELMLDALGRGGRIREGEEHVAAAVRSFEAEGLDSASIRSAWKSARSRAQSDVTASTVLATRAAPTPSPASSSSPPAVNPRGIVIGAARRASVAIMPFVDRAASKGIPRGLADALAHDVIIRLAKLRSVFVIAQGTVFALHERAVSAEEAGRMLNVDYIVSGSTQRRDARLSVSVELAETRTARIVWAETFDHKLEDALLVLDEIGNRIVASVASEIETVERNRAILRPPCSLDAWEAHHRGLWHMYRFNQTDNERARHYFEMAVRLDPTFARAYAGLSFTHWQNAFQGWTAREQEAERAFEAAGQSLMVDDRDPAAHWAMGRALWLRGSQDESVTELGRAIDLSPNFALGHYALAFVHSQGGDPRAALGFADQSRQLSPFDPMLFAMLGARAMALVRLEQFEEAADWALKAAARPNAHAHIRAIAACCLSLAGRREEALALVASIRKTLPQYSVDDFLAAFRFGEDGTALFRRGAKNIGI
jgi:TolB-like protein/DNA-binding SARP family transcriptional activator/Flp pilus assembly protein TadD